MAAMEFPEDITVEILKHLPAKTLVRFRCVSRLWRSILTTQSFIRSHLARVKSLAASNGVASSVIMSRYGDSLISMDPTATEPQEATELDFPMVPYFPYYVKGHCDGLICCVVNDGAHGHLLLYNANINEHRKMPIPPNFRSTREVFGLGFDDVSNDYKIVRFPSMYCRLKVPDFVAAVEVFSLRTNSWRRIPAEDVPPYFVEHVFQATNVDGGIYWLAEEGDTLRCVILRFDLSSEKFSVVAPPPDPVHGRGVSWIGTLRGRLCAAHTQRMETVEVWGKGAMGNGAWTLMVSVPRWLSSPSASPFGSRYTPLCFTEGGELVMAVGGEGFVAYDGKNGGFRRMEVGGAEHYLQETVVCESLVSPYMGRRRASVDDEEWLADTTSNTGIRQLIIGLRRGFSSRASQSKHR